MRLEQSVVLPRGFTIDRVLEFVHLANSFQSNIWLTNNNHTINGKGILGMVSLFLTLEEGKSFNIVVDGCDALVAIDKIESWISSERKNEIPEFQEQEALSRVKEVWEQSNFKWTPQVSSLAKSSLKVKTY